MSNPLPEEQAAIHSGSQSEMPAESANIKGIALQIPEAVSLPGEATALYEESKLPPALNFAMLNLRRKINNVSEDFVNICGIFKERTAALKALEDEIYSKNDTIADLTLKAESLETKIRNQAELVNSMDIIISSHTESIKEKNSELKALSLLLSEKDEEIAELKATEQSLREKEEKKVPQDDFSPTPLINLEILRRTLQKLEESNAAKTRIIADWENLIGTKNEEFEKLNHTLARKNDIIESLNSEIEQLSIKIKITEALNIENEKLLTIKTEENERLSNIIAARQEEINLQSNAAATLKGKLAEAVPLIENYRKIIDGNTETIELLNKINQESVSGFKELVKKVSLKARLIASLKTAIIKISGRLSDTRNLLLAKESENTFISNELALQKDTLSSASSIIDMLEKELAEVSGKANEAESLLSSSLGRLENAFNEIDRLNEIIKQQENTIESLMLDSANTTKIKEELSKALESKENIIDIIKQTLYKSNTDSAEKDRLIKYYTNSYSWKLTKPFRALRSLNERQ